MKTAILKNIYRNGNKVPMMFRNGDLIYHMITKLVFGVDTDSLIFPLSGGTQTITITANDDWTMTVPNWLTASALSGTTGATITLTASSSQEEKSGSIVISCGDRTHTITVKQGVSLPEKTFVFNYNARDYNPSTFTIPKTSGQTMDMDMVWTATTSTIRNNIQLVDGDHLTIPESAYTYWNFGSQAANPMNLIGSTKNITLVFKTRQTGGNTKGTFFANRGEASNNYVLRIGTETGYNTTNIHLDGSTTTFAEPSGLTYNSANVLTAAVRVTNMQVEIMNLETGDNNTPYTITCPQASVQFAFFGYKGNYSYANEPMAGDFYWCYASREVLTDEEIQQVVEYNNYTEPTPPTPPTPTPTPYDEQYFTVEATSSGTIELTPRPSLFYDIYARKNGGEWGTTLSWDVVSGETIEFKSTNSILGSFQASDSTIFSGSTAAFKVYGNVMSLFYNDDFTGRTDFKQSATNYALSHLFEGTNVVDASNLILPATALTSNCYKSMFSGCTSLTTAPALPATTLASGCCQSMFDGCSNLTTAPSVLPATTLADRCYSSMFKSCKNLTTAPELPATTLTDYCYQYMFRACSKLNYVKCLATDISATNCTQDWLGYILISGTFVKNAATSDWSTGASGIPSNWTVVDAS